MAEMLIVKSKLRDVAKGCNVGGDVADALNKMAHEQIKLAAKRADANDRKTIQAKDVYMGKPMCGEMLVVKSKIKGVAGGHNVSGEFATGLNELIAWHLMQACERAMANGRKTVQARDI